MSAKLVADVFDDPKAFRTRVRMPAVQVEGLSSEDLSRALAYEVEPQSGIPAAEAEVCFRSVPEEDPTVRVYDIAVRHRGVSHDKVGLSRFLPFAYVFAAFVLCAVAVDFAYLKVRLSRVRADIERRLPLDRRVRAVADEARALRSEANRLRTARESSVRAQADVASLRAASADVLSLIASSCADRAVLREITSIGPFSVRIRAVAISSEAAAETMSAMTAAAGTCGWKFVPGGIEASGSSSTAAFEGELSHD